MYRMGGKFQGVQIFVDFVALTIHKNKPLYHQPTNSLCFGYPRNFKPLKLNTITVSLHM